VLCLSADSLGTVKPHGPVNAAVADEHHIVRIRVAVHLVKGHIRGTGAALEKEDRLSRMTGFGEDSSYRQSDQARLRVNPPFRDDEGAALGGIVAVLGRVLARFQDQIAGLRAFRHRRVPSRVVWMITTLDIRRRCDIVARLDLHSAFAMILISYSGRTRPRIGWSRFTA
jgi:hypothetical protein